MMSTRSRRQLSVICLQLAWLEEQKSSLADTVAVIENAIKSGRQWIHQDADEIDFHTLCEALERTSALVVQKCSDILNENCSPFMYQADNDRKTEKESNQEKDIEPETQHTVSEGLESNSVSDKTDTCLSTSEPELTDNCESECLPHRTEGNVSQSATKYNEVSEFELCQFETGGIEIDKDNLYFKCIEGEFVEQINNSFFVYKILHKFSEGNDVNANHSATVDKKQDLAMDQTSYYDRVKSVKTETDSFKDSTQQTESIASDTVTKETNDHEKESDREENVSVMSHDGKKEDTSLEAQESQQTPEVTNSKHEIKTSGDTLQTTSEEESVEEFYEFLIKMLMTSSDTNPIECLIKGVDSVDGKFLDRVTERKSRDPIKDQLIQELTNRRLYHYRNRENIREASPTETIPKGILRSGEANGEPPKTSFTGVGARKRVTFNESKSEDVKTVFESFHKPKEENKLMTSKSEFDDKGKNVTLLGVRHFSEFFETRVQKESPKTSHTTSTKNDPTTTKRPPAFTACIPYGVFHTVTTGATITSFDDVICNAGNHFNPQTGEFTAPSGGVYVISVTLRQVGAGYVGVDVIRKTDNAAGRSESRVSGAHTPGDGASASCLGVTEMMAGDMIYLKGLQRGDAQLNMFSSFSCFKLT